MDPRFDIEQEEEDSEEEDEEEKEKKRRGWEGSRRWRWRWMNGLEDQENYCCEERFDLDLLNFVGLILINT
jgi:hypothetical protein